MLTHVIHPNPTFLKTTEGPDFLNHYAEYVTSFYDKGQLISKSKKVPNQVIKKKIKCRHLFLFNLILEARADPSKISLLFWSKR